MFVSKKAEINFPIGTQPNIMHISRCRIWSCVVWECLVFKCYYILVWEMHLNVRVENVVKKVDIRKIYLNFFSTFWKSIKQLTKFSFSFMFMACQNLPELDLWARRKRFFPVCHLTGYPTSESHFATPKERSFISGHMLKKETLVIRPRPCNVH